MIMLVTAIAIAAATPVAAQTADPTHSGHGTPAPVRSGKGCCCCDSRAADNTDTAKRWNVARRRAAKRPPDSIRNTNIRPELGRRQFVLRPVSSTFVRGS